MIPSPVILNIQRNLRHPFSALIILLTPLTELLEQNWCHSFWQKFVTICFSWLVILVIMCNNSYQGDIINLRPNTQKISGTKTVGAPFNRPYKKYLLGHHFGATFQKGAVSPYIFYTKTVPEEHYKVPFQWKDHCSPQKKGWQWCPLAKWHYFGAHQCPRGTRIVPFLLKGHRYGKNGAPRAAFWKTVPFCQGALLCLTQGHQNSALFVEKGTVFQNGTPRHCFSTLYSLSEENQNPPI